MDRYINGQLVHEDAALQAALTASEAAGLPPASVTPSQGKLLQLLVHISGARHVLKLA